MQLAFIDYYSQQMQNTHSFLLPMKHHVMSESKFQYSISKELVKISSPTTMELK